jgi:hypothetical protein
LAAVVILSIGADLLVDEERQTELTRWAEGTIATINQAQRLLAEKATTIPLQLSLAMQIDTLSGTITELVQLPNPTAADTTDQSASELIKAAIAAAALKTIATAPVTTPTVEPHLNVAHNPYQYLSKQLAREIMLTPERSQTDVRYLPPLLVFVLDEKRKTTRTQGVPGKEVTP